MADIFLSYASEDRERVRPIVELLEQRGRRVWWDRDILGGTRFDNEIERELDAAAWVIVVWSRDSISSEWVKTEAFEALETGRLVPVRVDQVKPPLAFRRVQTIDISSPITDHELDELCGALTPDAESHPRAAAPPRPDVTRSIEVEPFKNLSGDDHEHFAVGFTEDLMSQLARNYWSLAVIPAADSMSPRRSVAYRLSGSVRKHGDRFRVVAKLTQPIAGAELWSESFDIPDEDLFKLQDQIVVQTTTKVLDVTEIDAVERLQRYEPEVLDAWGLTVRAWSPPISPTRSRADLEMRRRLLRQALELDPKYAFAHAVLSNVLSEDYVAMFSRDIDADGRDALEHVETALELAGTDAIVLAWVSSAIRSFDDPRRSLAVTTRALRRSPLHRVVRHRHALCLAVNGDPQAARELLEEHQYTYLITAELARICSLMRDFDAVIRYGEQVLIANRGSYQTRVVYANGLAALGEFERAEKELRKVYQELPKWSLTSWRSSVRRLFRRDDAVECLSEGLVALFQNR